MRTLLLCLLSASVLAQTTSITIPSQVIQVPTVAGPVGPTGATGPAGPAGAQGPAGPGPTDAQVAAAVAAYLSANPITGTAPTSACGPLNPNGTGPAIVSTTACPAGYTGTYQATTQYNCPAGATSWAVQSVSPPPAGACTAIVATTSPKGTSIPTAAQIVDTSGNIWTLVGGVVQENGKPAGFSAAVVEVYWDGTTIYQSTSATLWWSWNGTTWVSTASPIATNTPPPTCAQSASSATVSGSKVYGLYELNTNNWAGIPGLSMWANSADCWGFTDTATTEAYSIRGAPQIARGWSQANNAYFTTDANMGVQVQNLTKAKAHWAFTPPTAVYPAARWDALLETDLWNTDCKSGGCSYYGNYQLTIQMYTVDQVLNGSSYYCGVLKGANYSLKTFNGIQYATWIDQSTFNSAGGHTIFMYPAPNCISTGNAGLATWGLSNSTIDLAPIFAYWSSANPKDDAGNPVKYANGTVVTTPVIPPTAYLNSIQAGFEVDFMPGVTNNTFCVAMQAEGDCP
nr:hypothetical protein [uncultured Rhodopila sp.]